MGVGVEDGCFGGGVEAADLKLEWVFGVVVERVQIEAKRVAVAVGEEEFLQVLVRFDA